MSTLDPLATILGKKSVFRGRLLRWYERNRRPLPWREVSDPYAIWVSEIMLQQTRVNAVLGHYQRFHERFPTVGALAAASEADVLAAWSGLGYYGRARRMRLAAQAIMVDHGGAFPTTAESLQTLPGIGRYTAAAIASIAYDERQAVVDGNVERVVERMAGKPLPQKVIWEFVQQAVSPRRPGDFNQAMMELGATVCTPRNPSCGVCPVRNFCRSRGRELVAGPKPARLVAELKHAFALRGDKVLLVQRSRQASLMAGMWELPVKTGPRGKVLLQLRHSITVTDYRVKVYAARSDRGSWVSLSKVQQLPLTGLARKVLTRLGAIASPA